MKVVLISPNPASNTGGVERFCALLAAILERAGWDTAIVGPDVQLPDAAHRVGLGPSFEACSAARRARAEAADLVISNGFLGGPAGARRIHVFHGTMIRHVAAARAGSRWYRFRQGFGAAVPEALCGRGATVVAVSRSAAREVRQLYRQRVDAVIPNGVDTDLFRPGDRSAERAALDLRPDSRYALFVGRFERRKGADLVPQACRKAGFELLVAGPNSAPSARSLGNLSPAQLAGAYRAVDCVVLPTRYEACSFVVLETLASGVPLITTEVGWMEEFVEQCPGYRRYIVKPEIGSIVRALAAVDHGGEGEVLAAAREIVRARNSLESFGRSWLELIASTTG